MVTSNDLGVRRRDNALAVGAALARGRDAVLLLRRLALAVAPRAVVHGAVGVRLLVIVASGGAVLLDVDVGDAAALAVARQGLVLVGGLGELGDDVPGVEEARDEAEAAEEDVDERVGAADAALDPD